MICQQCSKEMPYSRPSRAQKFCSAACYHDSLRVVDLWTLKKFCEAGIGKTQMARSFGVQRKTIRELITNHGLEKLWRQRRYHMAGVVLATTASEAQTSAGPFARSA